MPIATDLTLEPISHTYRDSKGIEYKSVSKVIGHYKEPFDRDKIAKLQAKKNGVPVEEILAEWDTAAPYGTAVHEQLEHYFLKKDFATDLIEPYLDVLSLWRSQDAIFYPETILYHPELRIAGTADMIIERDGHWSIIDWKTNKKIYKTAFRGAKLKGSLSHLEDCNFIHYSLQLSIYATMLGMPIHKLSLIHLPRSQNKLEIITCPFLKDEVQTIFEECALTVA